MNKVLENARTGKLIGSSLEAKIYLHISDAATSSKLGELHASSNDADALHRIFITSQVSIFYVLVLITFNCPRLFVFL